jgi:hypothetical protein
LSHNGRDETEIFKQDQYRFLSGDGNINRVFKTLFTFGGKNDETNNVARDECGFSRRFDGGGLFL